MKRKAKVLCKCIWQRDRDGFCHWRFGARVVDNPSWKKFYHGEWKCGPDVVTTKKPRPTKWPVTTIPPVTQKVAQSNFRIPRGLICRDQAQSWNIFRFFWWKNLTPFFWGSESRPSGSLYKILSPLIFFERRASVILKRWSLETCQHSSFFNYWTYLLNNIFDLENSCFINSKDNFVNNWNNSNALQFLNS